MRYTTRPVLGVLLAVVLGAHGSAEETKAPWWHFGMSKHAPSAPESVTPAPTMTPASPMVTSVEEESWFAWPSLPKWSWRGSAANDDTAVSDPFSTSAPVAAGTESRTQYGKPIHRSRPRNSWAQQPASTAPAAPSASPWHTVTAGTRNAWHKTVDFVTPGESADAPVVASNPRPSWWHRMWGSEDENEGPQTVTEWMAQDRLDP